MGKLCDKDETACAADLDTKAHEDGETIKVPVKDKDVTDEEGETIKVPGRDGTRDCLRC